MRIILSPKHCTKTPRIVITQQAFFRKNNVQMIMTIKWGISI